METIIARQPIFNKHRRLFAYELLYRGEESLQLDKIGGDRATTTLLSSAFLTEGLDRISGNKPCFVNFTEQLLTADIAENFPTNKIVIEILEDVIPTPKVIECCKTFKELGYTLALDDFIFEQKLLPLIELADIIKFDFRISTIKEIEKAIYYLGQYKLEFLAEKVETNAEFEKALKLGFNYFQGYFFARPELIRIKELSASKINLLNILAEINRSQISQEKMTRMISADVSLSYKLLRYINSAYFYLVNEILSIAHAVTYLGDKEIRRFVNLVVISEISSTKPAELVKLASVRAKFCELLGAETNLESDQDELFLLGLFSLLPAMLDKSMVNILERLPIASEIKSALIQKEGSLAPYLQATISYEKRQKEACLKALETLQIDKTKVYPLYLQAVDYGEQFARL